MDFEQISPLIIEPQARQVIADSFRSLPENIKALLQIGRTLQVTVAVNSQRETGIIIGGCFLRASLPEGCAVGQELSVLVLENQRTLVLKVLDKNTIFSAQLLRQLGDGRALEEILRALLSESGLEKLKRSALPPQNMPPQETEKNPASFDQLKHSKNNPWLDKPNSDPPPREPGSFSRTDLLEVATSKQPQTALQGLNELISEKLALSEKNAHSPEQLSRVLFNLSRNELLKNLLQAKNALQELSRTASPQVIKEILEAISGRLNALLAADMALSFEENQAPSHASSNTLLASQLKLLVALSHYALATGNQALLNALHKDLAMFNTKANPLLILLRLLGNFNPFLSETSNPEEQALFQTLSTLISELSKLKNIRAGEENIRQTLARSLNSINELTNRLIGSKTEAGSAKRTLSFFAVMEPLLQGQEILNQLNPLMQSAGQPALVLIPAWQEGRLSRWELLIMPPKVEDDPQDQGCNTHKQTSKQRLQLNLSLPGLGPVQVDLSCTKGETFLNFTFEKKESELFAKQYLPLLKQRLTALGYENLKVQTRQAQLEPIEPQWYRKLCRRSIIA